MLSCAAAAGSGSGNAAIEVPYLSDTMPPYSTHTSDSHDNNSGNTVPSIMLLTHWQAGMCMASIGSKWNVPSRPGPRERPTVTSGLLPD